MPIKDLPAALYNAAIEEVGFIVEHSINDKPTVTCPDCGSVNVRKVPSLGCSYTRGYGYLDKKGTRNDMNLHTMTSGADPYASSRQRGDAAELIGKLRRNKSERVRRDNVYMKS